MSPIITKAAQTITEVRVAILSATEQISLPVRAKLFVMPGPAAGHMLAESLSFLAQTAAAGIVVGAGVPIILTSRADSEATSRASRAIAALVADARPETTLKAAA